MANKKAIEVHNVKVAALEFVERALIDGSWLVSLCVGRQLPRWRAQILPTSNETFQFSQNNNLSPVATEDAATLLRDAN